MKKMLSIFLSLALLATVLVIPMTTSAATTGTDVTTTEFSLSESGNYYKADDPTRISDGLMPIIRQTATETRERQDKSRYLNANKAASYGQQVYHLTDGVLDEKPDDIYTFSFSPNGAPANGYVPGTAWNSSSTITRYVDVIFDLGEVTTINKIQHIAHDHPYAAGLYQVYTATDINQLFRGDPLLTYQNMDTNGSKGSQQHEFAATQARFVAFRILAATINGGEAYCLRMYELAIYGTPVGLSVNAVTLPISGSLNIADTAPEGTQELLAKSTRTNHLDWKTDNMDHTGIGDSNILHNGIYCDNSSTDIASDFGNPNGGTIRSGYVINRNIDGTVDFRHTDITYEQQITFSLDGVYNIKQFGFASGSTNEINYIQAYELYIGTDKANLYTSDNLVATYDNCFSTPAQIFNFTETQVGSYIGIRVLMAGWNGAYNCVRASEIWAYGTLKSKTTEFKTSQIDSYYTANDPTRISDGLMPVVLGPSGPSARYNLSKQLYYNDGSNGYTDGVLSGSKKDVYLASFYDGTAYANGYVPGTPWNSSSTITKYVDIIFDLGEVTTINKIQHISYESVYATGLYQIYTATDISELFSGDPLLTYQNMHTDGSYGSQQHEFAATQARFVAFRVLAPTINGTTNSNGIRIYELAIYGTPVGYTVNSLSNDYCAGNAYNVADTAPAGTTELLKDSTLKFVSEENGGTREWGDLFGGGRGKVHDGAYGNCDPKHADVYYGVDNGYAVAENANGSVTVTHDDITRALRMTFELDGIYNIKQFGFASSAANAGWSVLAYEVYIGTDEEHLYDSRNLVHSYINYFGSNTQIFNFSETHVGSYIGVRLLDAGTYTNDSTPRLSEIWAYGNNDIGVATDDNLTPAMITSNTVYIYDDGTSSVYTSEKDGTQRTAARLTVGYKAPKVLGGADATKIVLKGGKVANVIEREVIAIAHSKYTANGLSTLDINTEGASVSKSFGSNVANYFKSKTIDDTYCEAYGALNLNNISQANKDSEFVVRGRVVYEIDGEYYEAYSAITGASGGLDAQWAYEALCADKGITTDDQGWFK